MNDKTWHKAKELFHEARSLPANTRCRFLDERCLNDKELRNQVEEFLGFYDSEFLESSPLMNANKLLENDNFVPGRMIGRYHISELIGTGGMGQVFLADDTELNRPVAFKVLHDDVAGDKERVRRFIQEARAASALNHPNILTIHEIGTFEGSRFIVSEYVDGKTLRERMSTGLTAAESLEITCQIAAALQAAHSAGIVHRDIKPENIMLRQDGLVKVLDFGLAKLTEADDLPIDANNRVLSRVHTSPGLVMGTVAYMSPEQARGQAVDSRTDLWSLGVVFHEMLTGESPFEGDSVTDLVTSILKHDATSLDLKSISQELQPICVRALAKDKKTRYQTAQELLQDLQGEKKRMEYATQSTPFITVSSTDELKTQLIRQRPTLSAEYIVSSVKRHKYASLAAIALILAGALISVYNYNGATPPNAEQPFGLIDSATTENDLKFSRLPISGQTNEAALSPDGKYVAYNDAKGIHLLNLEDRSDVVILAYPPADGAWWLTFSPDNAFVYYVYETNADFKSDKIMRIPIRGGTPTTVISEVPEDGFGFSPDGSTMAFARERPDGVELVLANIDGSNQRVLVKPSGGSGIVNRPMFSPDGKTVACQVRYKAGNATYVRIVGFTLAGAEQRVVSDKEWANIFGGVWLPNGNIIVSAVERSSDTQVPGPPQLWLIPADGAAKPITNGLFGYQGLSATRDGSVLLSSQTRNENNLWLLPNNDTAKAQRVTTSGEIAGGFAAAPDRRIVFGSRVTGNSDLWIMDRDGSGRKQLTQEGGLNVMPDVSPNNKYIVFSSSRGDGKARLYRMDIDGQNVKQLTDGSRDSRPEFSGDGKWVYYLEENSDGVWDKIRKVSIDGGGSVVVASPPEGWEFVAMDVDRSSGRVACGLTRKPNGPRQYKLGVIPTNGNSVARMIDLSANLNGRTVRWVPGGRSLATISFGPDFDIWQVPVEGKSKPSRITNFKSPMTNNFIWTADGRSMLVARGTSTSDPVLIRNTGN